MQAFVNPHPDSVEMGGMDVRTIHGLMPASDGLFLPNSDGRDMVEAFDPAANERREQNGQESLDTDGR